MKFISKLFFIGISVFLIFSQNSYAQKQELKLTGNLALDSKLVQNTFNETAPSVQIQNPNQKSRYLAGGLSLILPGAGEFYTHHYLKAAIFFVVEAAAVTTAIIYRHKGDFQTAFFEQYANEHWSAKKYSEWTLNNAKSINPDLTDQQIQYFKNNILNSDGTVNWSIMNQMESTLSGGYTHRLPHKGDQQYYELIGKYPQYSHGWDSADFNDNDYHILTHQFLWYSHQRGVANDYYNTSATAVVLVFVNHILSAADAIWSADMYNDNLAMNMRINTENYYGQTVFVPTLNLSYNF